MFKPKLTSAFTLMEMLIVITIMVALIAFAAPNIANMFQSSEINRATRIIERAMLEARSEAIKLNVNTAVLFSFRSLEEQEPAKVWVIRGDGEDKDVAGSILQGMLLDEGDITTNVPSDDVILLTSYTLPSTVFLHGLCTGASANAAPRGHYTRWYAVFNAEGTCFMVRPDGGNEVDEAPTSGTLATWRNANDYLPDNYEHNAAANEGLDTNISDIKADEAQFEADAKRNHDMKVYNDEEEIYLHLQENLGRFHRKKSVE